MNLIIYLLLSHLNQQIRQINNLFILREIITSVHHRTPFYGFCQKLNKILT